MNILDCSLNGDKRYTPQFCFVESFGVRNSIENHYQMTKRFTYEDGAELIPTDWRDVHIFKEKGAVLSRFELPNGMSLGETRDSESLVAEYYTLLWYKFLSKNLHLIEHAMKYDGFISGLEEKHEYTHAHIIRDTISHGLDYIKSRGESLAFAISLYAKEQRKNT